MCKFVPSASSNEDYEDSSGQRCVMLAQNAFKARRERYLTRLS